MTICYFQAIVKASARKALLSPIDINVLTFFCIYTGNCKFPRAMLFSWYANGNQHFNKALEKKNIVYVLMCTSADNFCKLKNIKKALTKQNHRTAKYVGKEQEELWCARQLRERIFHDFYLFECWGLLEEFVTWIF